jgi:hypothetical protein
MLCIVGDCVVMMNLFNMAGMGAALTLRVRIRMLLLMQMMRRG